MTEDEAKTKWCPFVRVPNGLFHSQETPTVAANRDGDGEPLASMNCIGSGCMAWRWDKPATPADVEQEESGTQTPRVKIAPPKGAGWVGIEAGRDKPGVPGEPPYRWVVWERPIAAVPGEGHCGLAGAPQ